MRAPVAWQDWGSEDAAATLVLLHGLTDSGQCWPDAVARWVSQGFRVVAADARGHGRSPRWVPAELDPAVGQAPGDVMAEDVLRLLATLPCRSPVVLVGHSMGAAAAVAAAARLPGNTSGPDVVGVVAEDPPWRLPPQTGPDPDRVAHYLAGWDDDAARTTSERVRLLGREHPAWPLSEVQACAAARDLCQRDLLATGDIVPRTPWPDLVAVLASNGPPLLVVTGDDDVRITQESAFVAERRGARVVRLRGAGHCVRRDAAEAYHAVVDAFVGDVTA